MNVKELQEKRRKAQTELSETRNNATAQAESEKRGLTPVEKAKIAAKTTEIEQLNEQIENELLEARHNMKTPKSQRKTPLLVNMLAAELTNSPMPDVEARAIAAARQTHTGFNSTANILLALDDKEARATLDFVNDGANMTDTTLFNMVAPLRQKIGVVVAGAQFITGLSSELLFPKLNAITADWEGENSEAKDGGNGTGSVKYSPKRLTTSITISRKLLVTDNAGAEAIIRADILAAIATKIDQTVFGGHTASTTIPAGFFSGLAAEKNLGAASWAKVVGLETVTGENAAPIDTPKYVLGSSLAGILKVTPKDTGSGRFVLENGEMNGYPVVITNNVAKSLAADTDEYGIVFGTKWSEYIVAGFGAMEITTDPYTRAKEGLVVLTINSYWDLKPRTPEAFAAASMK